MTRKKIRWLTALGCLLLLLAGLFTAMALWDGVVFPAADGDTKKDGSLTVDCSHMDQGYIMVKASSSSKKYKLRIAKGKSTLTYDLNSDGEYEVFPLQLGSGKYTVSLYKNAKGKKYSQEGTVKLKVELTDEMAAFLCPNQYVNYDENTAAVALSDELCEGLTTETEKFEAIRSYMATNFVYDYIKAATVSSGTMPDIDGTLESKQGICQDLSALSCCMLRVQGIHAEFAVGYADKQYHAWVIVYLDGDTKGQLYDPTAELNGIASGSKYTLERYY